MAPTYGWSLMATWIKAVAVGAAALTGLWTLYQAGSATLDWAAGLPWPTAPDIDGAGLVTTLDQPVERYLADHTAALPTDAATAYTLWQTVGTAAFLTSWWFRSTGARLTWTAWGAATTAMIWAATPTEGRPVATALAVLAWTLASTLALRGLSLRPAAFIHIHNQPPQIHADIHLPKNEPTHKPYDPSHYGPSPN